MDKLKTDRAHDLLLQLAEVPSVRDEAVGAIHQAAKPADLQKLGPLLASTDTSDRLDGFFFPMFPIASEIHQAFGDAAVPYLLEGIKKGGYAESCVRELARSNSVEGFGLFKDALENDRPYKQAVVTGLRDVLPSSWQPSEAELLNLVNEKLASLTASH